MRSAKFDNIRFILMYLVVLGHLLELMPKGQVHVIYQVIYAFHMPAFVFLTGYFAKPGARRAVRLVVLYVIFQIAYLVFAHLLSGEGGLPALQFAKPYWLLWYLMACIYYQLVLPLVETSNPRRMGVVLALAVACAVGVGFVPQVGYFLSASRAVVFFPFFVAGHYLRRLASEGRTLPGFSLAGSSGLKPKGALVAACAVCALAGSAALAIWPLPDQALYGSCSYEVAGFFAWQRVLVMLLAACWIVLLLGVGDRRVPLATDAGARTLPIFLFHGFIMKAMARMGLFGVLGLPAALNLAIALVAAALVELALGIKPLNDLLRIRLPLRAPRPNDAA